MKKVLKLVIILSIVGVIIYGCSGHEYRIKTEYGDEFFCYSDSWGECAFISCPVRNFDLSISNIDSKKDIIPICDTELFRCYIFSNTKENFYICGLNPDGDYFWIDPNAETTPTFFKEEYSEDFLKVFLADKYIMQVTMNYMDGVYHEEIMEMAQKLTSGNYEGLDKYGLTEEMINDKESLDEKISIMEEYLKANKEQTGTSSTVH